jgi:hypothetical protein
MGCEWKETAVRPAIFEEWFNTIERLFGWEDKFLRLLLRFDRLSQWTTHLKLWLIR